MNEMLFQDLLAQIPSHINIVLLLGLMALGYIIKHSGICGKVSNKLIPIILAIAAIIAILFTSDLSSKEHVFIAIINGVVNAAIAVWIHETGKNIFEMYYDKKDK